MRPTSLAVLLILGASPALLSAQGTKGFRLTSPDLRSGARVAEKHVFNGMGCTGANVSPALSWSGAPKGTKSYAVTMYDPDAPTGSGWWHWVIYNIPATATGLVADAGNPSKTLAPTGAQEGNTDFGKPGYGGPCPPPGHGPHHYVITAFALKVDRIDVPANATAAMVGYNLNANTLAKAKLNAIYGR